MYKISKLDYLHIHSDKKSLIFSPTNTAMLAVMYEGKKTKNQCIPCYKRELCYNGWKSTISTSRCFCFPYFL